MSELLLTPEGSLLLTLEEISQLVSHSHDPAETLANIVRLIQGRFHTDVCSVYLLEPERGELVLGATVGLKPESVGRVRMRLDEGLTGLAAQQMTPVMVDDAFQHPRFKYFPEAGEDPYHSFLGIPLVEGGVTQGVLVVQTVEPRAFSPNELRMLVTAASQLAPLVSGARLLERVAAATHEPRASLPADLKEAAPSNLRGTSLSPGSGAGQAYLVNGFETWPHVKDMPAAEFPEEKQRLFTAMEAAREEINRLSQRISEMVGENHGAILQAQLMMMQDRTIEQDLTDCLAAGQTAEGALIQTLHKYVAAFQKLSSPFFQERVYDVKDIFRRILWHLLPRLPGKDAGGRLVLVAHEASVMDLFSVDLERLAAVVVERGGPQSHAAILARSLGIPMVGQLPEFVHQVHPGQHLLVNGQAGILYLDPAPDLMRESIAEVHTWMPSTEGITHRCEGSGLPQVEVNINLLCEVPAAMKQRASGVGLFRTEFLFLARRTLPTEEEQVGIYRKLLEMLQGRPATIRTFDLRPDKLAHSAHLTSSAAGPLDWRLVLESPPLQKLFKDQVRAILRASTAGPARILVPLVTRSEQLDFIVATVAAAREELGREGLEFRDDVPLGIMIEVAAATAMAEAWAEEVDFFALGTNDLIASALGLDRDDPVGASQNDPLHPGLLRMIYNVTTAAHQAGNRVNVCGEMATDPVAVRALTALQVDALSVPVNQLEIIRSVLDGVSPQALVPLVRDLLDLRTAGQVRAFLSRR